MEYCGLADRTGQGVLGQGDKNVYNKYVKINNIDGNEIKEIQTNTDSNTSSAMIIMNNGDVYGGGCEYGYLGGAWSKATYEKINGYNDIKEICLGAESAYFIKNDGTLYGCGYRTLFESNSNITPEKAIKIEENVKQVKEYQNYVYYITKDNKLYVKFKTDVKQVTNIEINDETILGDRMTVISNDILYYISNGQASKLRENSILPYYNNYGGYKFLQTRGMRMYISKEGKIYIREQPNLTKIGEKANYTLRKVFENVVFVQGMDSYISIVDRNGKVYESVTSSANPLVDNAKKIVASGSAKYIIKNDGTLWARGEKTTGMWGEYVAKSNYIQVTKDGNENFTNVKDIFVSSRGSSCVFITEDNKMYWAGSTAYITLPSINGDYDAGGDGVVTNYPKEVTSPVIEQIRGKIKDIQYSSTNTGGIQGNVVLILTEDGKLYTMSNNTNMAGNNSYANSASGDFTEITIKEGTTVKQILTYRGFSLALLSNGEVYGWGYNTYGILGPKYEIGGIYPTPVKLEGLPANIRYMSMNNGFAIFASKSGEVYGIGKNDYGQLGTGDNIGQTEFVRCTKLEE